ncbi:MAG: methylated-DNA--[protein]-cysteine S-methyltransferase [Thermodesulfobacteriota bacterium]
MNKINAPSDYEKIEKAILYLSSNYQEKPALKNVANAIGLSEPHTHRLFKRWAGLTPKQFIQFIAKENIKKILSDSKNLLDASVSSKLSSQSRLYDLFVTYEAVTPGEFKTRGNNLHINYGIHQTQFGKSLIGITDRGICYLSFLTDSNEEKHINDLRNRWKNATIAENSKTTSKFIDMIFNRNKRKKTNPFHLHLKGTNFQIKVWEALLTIPEGTLITYSDLAKCIERPDSVRAVSNAVANNPVSLLIPCHRVIKKSGVFHNYGGGKERKVAIILSEFKKLNS